jgi:hypothetical protein
MSQLSAGWGRGAGAGIAFCWCIIAPLPVETLELRFKVCSIRNHQLTAQCYTLCYFEVFMDNRYEAGYEAQAGVRLRV